VDAIAACVGSWPLRDRIALLVWPAAYSDQWADVEATVRDLHIGGVVLMKPDDDYALHLGEHIADVDAVSAHGLLVATDEEGGQVQRLAVLGALPSQEAMSSESIETITATIGAHAQILAASGVDVIFGPVVDVRPEAGRDPLGHERLFVGDPERVGELGAAYVDGWRSAGLLPVLKHFPGHGSASADSHTGAATTPPLAQLLQRDLVPYERLAGSGTGVMVGHLTVPDLTDGVPASQSPAALALLRDELGNADAVVFSDALGMAAVGAPVPEAAVRAIRAGIDVVVFTSLGDTAGVIDAVEQAVASGDLAVDDVDDSAVRVARLEAAHGAQCVPASS
jgi:beta-N-acetylhexosaminidase